MRVLRRHFCIATFAVLMATPSGCSTRRPAKPDPQAADAAAYAAPTKLTATLVGPINIDLEWQDNATHEAGYFVEYSPGANDEFVIIEALPPNTTRYRHAHLLPHTRFVYRVRPFFGRPSNVASLRTGKTGPQMEPAPAMLKETPAPESEPKQSIRTTLTMNGAAPTDLTATLLPPAGVRLQWKDHATDADGYLLEIKPEGESRFKVSAFVKPGATSLTTYNFPLGTKFALRVRAFFYGQPSNLAEQTTGADPAWGNGPWIKTGPQTNP